MALCVLQPSLPPSAADGGEEAESAEEEEAASLQAVESPGTHCRMCESGFSGGTEPVGCLYDRSSNLKAVC